ncbi:hypothetical protein LCGC14_2545010, partial [marine sediment metagenome]
MKHIINIAPDPEKTIIDELKKHLVDEVRFKEIYPEFGNIRVSATHPFAYLMDQEINQNKVPVGLFPSITIVNDSDNRNLTLLMQKQVSTEIDITSTEIADIKANRNLYMISDKDVRGLEDLLDTYNGTLHASGVESFIKGMMVVEVWAENADVKNAIYDITRNFLLGIKRFTIQEKYGIIILEASIRGEKSGNYNFDFGFMTYG